MSFLSNIFKKSPLSEAIPLNETLSATTQKLCKEDAHRKESLIDIGQSICEDCSYDITITPRHLAQIHVASHVEGIPLEGTHVINSLNFWICLVEGWIQGKRKLVHFSLNQKQLTELYQLLLDVSKSYQQTTVSRDYEKTGEALRDKLLAAYKTHQPVVLIVGYSHGPKNQGHALPVRFQREGNTLVAYILNKGDGLHKHLILDYDSTSDYYALSYLPIHISYDKLQSDAAVSVLARLVRLSNEPPHPNVKKYSGKDIYDLFQLLGTPSTTYPKDMLKEWKGKPQRGYTCADKAVKLVVLDYLLRVKLPKSERDALFYNARAVSLIAAART